MGAKRFALGTVFILLAALILVPVAIFFYFLPSLTDPGSTIDQQVSESDLPVSMQGMSDAMLQEQLDDMLERSKGDRPELWWSARLEIEEIETVRLLSNHLGDDRTAVRSLLWLGEKLRWADQCGESLSCLEQAIAEAEALGFTEEVAQAHGYRGDCLKTAGMNYSAIEEYEQALEIYTELDLPVRMSWILSRLAHTRSHRLYDYDKAVEYFSRILDFGNRLEPRASANYQMMYALNLHSAGEYIESVDAFEGAAAKARQGERRYAVVSALDWADRMRILTNDPEFPGLSLLREDARLIGDDEAGTWTIQREIVLSDSVQLLEDPLQAISFLEKVLQAQADYLKEINADQEVSDLYKEIGDGEHIAYLAALGKLHLRLENYDDAINCFQRADSYVDREAGFILPMYRMELNLAMAQIGLGNYAEALPLLETARNGYSGG